MNRIFKLVDYGGDYGIRAGNIEDYGGDYGDLSILIPLLRMIPQKPTAR